MTDLFVAGIGASAGGLQAILDFFSAAVNRHVAYVVVQHLPRSYSSQLAFILQRFDLEVHEIEDGTEVKAAAVFIPPAGKYVSIADGRFSLMDRPDVRYRNHSIDYFFESLASKQRKAIAIVMSGTGTDGARGVQAVSASGGSVIVQNPDTALHEDMPRSSIECDHPDFILAPSDMPQAIDEIVERAA